MNRSPTFRYIETLTSMLSIRRCLPDVTPCIAPAQHQRLRVRLPEQIKPFWNPHAPHMFGVKVSQKAFARDCSWSPVQDTSHMDCLRRFFDKIQLQRTNCHLMRSRLPCSLRDPRFPSATEPSDFGEIKFRHSSIFYSMMRTTLHVEWGFSLI